MDISDPGSSAIGVYSTAFIPGFEGPGVEVPLAFCCDGY